MERKIPCRFFYKSPSYEEGRIVKKNGTFEWQWALADHLGNTRVLFSDTNNDGSIDAGTELLSLKNYYPFGMLWESGLSTSPKMRYGYNGKELDTDFGLNLHFYGSRLHDSALGRFTTVDPIAEQFPHLSTFNYANNNPISFIDVRGLFPWPVHVRSFISAKSVGLGMFRGDGRGASFGGTSRVHSSFVVDPSAGTVSNLSTNSDPTVFYGTPPFAMPPIPGSTKTPEPEVSISNVNLSGSSLSLGFSHEAKDPITPGFATPDLDLNASLSFSENLENGILSISGSFTGDNFPSAEAFINDQSGNSLFLGASMETGGVHSLFGENNNNKFNVNMQVLFNSDGNFTGVRQGDNTYSVQEWNKQIQNSFNK